MKYLLPLLFLISCTDTDLARLSSLGTPGEIECFSGGKSIYKGKSTGVIATVHQSDGWQFKEATTGKLIRVSGDCIIRN